MRNIIICCDGTGNDISENISNGLKLYAACARRRRRAAAAGVYDPGVGTLEQPDPRKLKLVSTKLPGRSGLHYGNIYDTK